MFGYTHDPETGGLLLDGLPARSSNEPRPVYASELNILGLDSYWKYENQDDFPYMWAEAGRYFYRGNFVFSTVGGSLTEKPGVTLTSLKDKDGKTFEIEGDSVVMSVGYNPAPLAKGSKHVHVIGDADKVGNLRTVIWGAWDACMKF